MMIENSAVFDITHSNDPSASDLTGFDSSFLLSQQQQYLQQQLLQQQQQQQRHLQEVENEEDEFMLATRLTTSPTISATSICVSSSSLEDDELHFSALLNSPLGSEESSNDDLHHQMAIMNQMYDHKMDSNFDSLSPQSSALPFSPEDNSILLAQFQQTTDDDSLVNSFFKGFDQVNQQQQQQQHIPFQTGKFQTLFDNDHVMKTMPTVDADDQRQQNQLNGDRDNDVSLSSSSSSSSLSLSSSSDSTAEVDGKKRKRSVVSRTTSSARKNSGTKSNKILKEIADEANKAIAAKNSVTKRRIKSSSSNEELDELEKNTQIDDKEKRRQRRLLKNRESAQASRERKKAYVQNLEQKVTELTTRNETLEGEMEELERENEYLREKIRRLERGDSVADMVIVNRSAKRQRSDLNHEAELTSQRKQQEKIGTIGTIANNFSSMMNPFDPSFWTLMSGFQTSQKRQFEQQQQNGQQPNDQTSTAASLAGRNVVMFIVLFCVAFMVVYPSMDGRDAAFEHVTELSHSATPTGEGMTSALSESVASTGGTTKRYIGRNILTARPDDSTIRIKFLSNTCANPDMSDEQRALLQEQFNRNMLIMSQQWMKNFTDVSDMIADSSNIVDDSVSFEFDKETQALTISMDKERLANMSGRKAKKRKLSGRSKQQQQQQQKRNSDEYMTLSRKLFRSICDMLDEIEASAS